MNDAETLALVLGGLHVLEGVVWVRAGATVFRSSSAARWTADRPAEWSPSLRGAPVFLRPFPPFEVAVLCADPPVSPTPDGVLVGDPPLRPDGPAPPPRLVPWAVLDEVRADGARVVAGDEPLAACATPAHAAAVADLVEAIRSAGEAARPAAVAAAIDRTLDDEGAARAVRAWRDATSVLGVSANVLFVALVVAVAGFAGAPVFAVAARWAAAFALAAFVFVVLDARRAHARLHPGEKGARRRMTWLLAASPLSAPRARAALARDLLAGTSPLGAAAALCPREEFEALARRTLADLRHPPPDDESASAAGAAREWFRRVRLERVEAFLRRRGADPDALLAPPVPRSPRDSSYCPRCRALYEIAGGSCTDCDGVVLRSLPSGVPSPPGYS